MRVLLTHDRFAPVFGGGGEYVALETAKGLIRNGVELKVLVGGDPRITSHEGVPTTRIPVPPARFNLAVRSIMEHARDADLIQTFTYHAALPSLVAGRLMGKPVVVYVLGIFGDAWKQVRHPLDATFRIGWEKMLVSRDYAHMFLPSERTRNLAIAMGANPAKSGVSHPGIGSDLKPGVKEDFVFFSGKAEKRKGTEDLLHVARALPHVRFRAMIWGPEREALQRAAPPNIEFPEYERGKVLQHEFATARIFFFPSIAETFGLALAEAMACGCAVVSSADTATDLPFEGIRVQPGNRESMIAGIDQLWEDPKRCASMGAANVATAGKFSWDAHIHRLQAVYRRILGCSDSPMKEIPACD